MARTRPNASDLTRVRPAPHSVAPGLQWVTLDLSQGTITDANGMQGAGTSLGKQSVLNLNAVHGAWDSGLDGWASLQAVNVPSTAAVLLLRLQAKLASNGTGGEVLVSTWRDPASAPSGDGGGTGVKFTTGAASHTSMDRKGGGAYSSGSILTSKLAIPITVVAVSAFPIQSNGRLLRGTVAAYENTDDWANCFSNWRVDRTASAGFSGNTIYLGLAAEVVNTAPSGGATLENLVVQYAFI